MPFIVFCVHKLNAAPCRSLVIPCVPSTSDHFWKTCIPFEACSPFVSHLFPIRCVSAYAIDLLISCVHHLLLPSKIVMGVSNGLM